MPHMTKHLDSEVEGVTMILSATHRSRNNGAFVERPWSEPRAQLLEPQAQLDRLVQHNCLSWHGGRGFGSSGGGISWETDNHASDVLSHMEKFREV